MAAANPAITRDEFDRMGKRLAALESSRSNAHADTLPPSDAVARFDPADFVRQGEFRLFKWLGTFAFATVLGGFGLLYEQTSDLSVAMERLHVDLLREMHAQNTSLRDEMNAQFASIREDMYAQFTSIREDMHAQYTSSERTCTRSTKRPAAKSLVFGNGSCGWKRWPSRPNRSALGASEPTSHGVFLLGSGLGSVLASHSINRRSTEPPH